MFASNRRPPTAVIAAVRAGRTRSRCSCPLAPVRRSLHGVSRPFVATRNRHVQRALRSFASASATSRAPTSWLTVLLDAGFLLGALDSSHLLLGKPNGTVIFSVVRSGTAVIAQVGTSCFQRRHVV